MRFFAAILVCGVAASYAQTPEVPHKMHFAGMSLTIRDDARREIQQDVDALTRPGRYFDMKVERAKTYFPIIEKIFSEENLPLDFKYLCLQESALVPDAVSVSNAVGFWQFKDFTAKSMGLRVDDEVDERMNIVSASRGAARYLKQNNTYFNNWLLALQAYQMGAGGVRRSVGDKYNGDSHMLISSDTYWYIKKYLAHKIAFENATQGEPKLRVNLYETSDKKLSMLAGEVAIDSELLQEYNKWAKQGIVPGDKRYAVMIPNGTVLTDFNNLVINSAKASKAVPVAKATTAIEQYRSINGLNALVAGQTETVASLALRANIDVSKFISFNDIAIDHEVKPGEVYFAQKKKKKNTTGIYKTKLGDDLWAVSQQFGVRIKNLKRLNPDIDKGLIPAGTLVRLDPKSRMEEKPVSIPEVSTINDTGSVAELSNESFNWPDHQSQTKIVKDDDDSKKIESFKKTEKTDSVSTDIKKTYNLPKDTTDTLKGDKPQEFIYTVKASDTLYSIARQNGATIKELMDWNSKSSLSVSVGEKLRILKK
ncbi:MAG: LysM peptidoglycan-binding domain-containing protein [Bacteroidetes bacterium]|nr:LysM peptidoglycan-binding domain-containing protein [Bacteroidota bacterium]MBS1539808.1 LysM peptidoglycan-binding domain-containing protein [Bacteroidota bacterium]